MFKVGVVYNLHRFGGGSDAVAKDTVALLDRSGEAEVVSYVEDSAELKGVIGALKAFVSPFIPLSIKLFYAFLDKEQPDIIHAHEVYPLISPWVLRACKRRGIPVVLTCHDYRLSCPIATHFRAGKLCFDCMEQSEFACIRHNCSGSGFKSLSYALRNWFSKRLGLFSKNVDLYLTPSEKTRQLLCEYVGLNPDLVRSVGNPVPFVDEESDDDWVPGDYIAYAGRYSPEKGFQFLVDACAELKLKLKVAGDFSGYLEKVPAPVGEISFLGALERKQMADFYRDARMTVVPSTWHETFGLVVAESLSRKTPVVVSDMGALAEVAGPGGRTFPAGNIEVLKLVIKDLWDRTDECKGLAESGAASARRFSSCAYVGRLIEIYKELLK